MYSFLNFNKSLLFLLFLAIISIFIDVVYCSTTGNVVDNYGGSNIGAELRKELMLTKREKQALDKLKLVMSKERLLPGFIKTELFQIRWLRAHSMDVELALRELNEVIEILRKQKVSDFWNDDWSDLFPKHPFAVDSFDKHGLPVVTLLINEVDVRRIMIQGKWEKLFKYFANVGFETIDRMTEINMHHPNITQVVFLANLDGFNPIQHTCPLCLTFYIYILELNERFLPGFTHDFIVINAPSVYGVFLEMFRPTLSEHTSSVLKIFGTNKNKWKSYLDSIIDPSQLPWEFGGTKVDRGD